MLSRTIQKFICMMCEDCCFFKQEEDMPIVFYWEKERLSEYGSSIGVKLRFKDFLTVDDGKEKFTYLYRWVIDGKCPFLRDNLCIIHKDKPLSCKIYPLIVEVPESRIHVSARCKWVESNMENIDPQDVPQIFDEFKIAVSMLAMVLKFMDIAKQNGWKIILHRDIIPQKV